MKIECVLVVDLGTSKVHTNLISLEDGHIVLGSTKPCKWFHPSEGWSEKDALSEWELTQSAVEDIVLKAKGKFEIMAISFSYFCGALLLLDRNGNPIRNMILTMDNRAVREGQELYDAFPELNVLSKNIGVAANSTAAKVLWLKKNSPEDIKKTALIGNIQHFFTHKLGLGLFTDQAHAYANGFFDLNQKEYSTALCDYLGFPVEKLGEKPLLGDTVLGKITKFGRVDLGKEVPVILGSYDVGCGMLGLGCNPSSKTIIADVTGTYDHIGRLTSNVDERFMCINGPIKDSYVLFAGAVVSGPNLEWYIKTFFPNEDSSIINRLFTLYPFDGNNKVFLSKDLNSGDGIIRGINFTTTNGDIFRAIIEGSTFPLINAVKAVTNEGKEKFDCIRIGGGSARSDKWSQLKADIFGIRVEKVANFEISSVGAAILASVAIGYYKDYSNAMNSLIQVEQVFNPISDLTKRYETRYLEYLNRLQQ